MISHHQYIRTANTVPDNAGRWDSSRSATVRLHITDFLPEARTTGQMTLNATRLRHTTFTPDLTN
jgi:hypothetical protein